MALKNPQAVPAGPHQLLGPQPRQKRSSSSFLHKAASRFSPDVLCMLPTGIIRAVEYKGADRWADAEDDRLIGGLCRFVMIKDKKWNIIEDKLRSLRRRP